MGKFSAVSKLATGLIKNRKLTNILKSNKIVKLKNAIKCGKMKQRHFLFKDFKMADRSLDKFEILEKIDNFQAGCVLYGSIGAIGYGMVSGTDKKKNAKCLDKALLALALGSLGFAVGGPIGAIVGNAIGLMGNLGIGEWAYEYDKSRKEAKEAQSQEQEQEPINIKA